MNPNEVWNQMVVWTRIKQVAKVVIEDLRGIRVLHIKKLGGGTWKFKSYF